MGTETAKHTPGPWEVKPNYNSSRNAIMAGKQRIAVVGETSITEGSPEANARVMAAGPDLLKACNTVVAFHAASYLPNDVYDLLLTAIAKTEGA